MAQRKKATIDGVELILSNPDVIKGIEWIGNKVYMQQLLAAWMVLDNEKDVPMNPQILGKPGVGKTTLAYCAAKEMKQPVYIFQCTVDTRPEDLIITPVIGQNNTIKYHASPLVTAMIKGGICILDEANRMSEKSWASLAPLLDHRRYIESIIAGIKINAHPDFRVCVTMNEDTSTFEVPEYIHSRLQPQIFIEFPEREDEFEILKFNIPYAKDQLIAYVTNFLQKGHKRNKEYTVRDGINILRYYLKIDKYESKGGTEGTEFNVPKTEGSTRVPANLRESPVKYETMLRSIKHILGKSGEKFFQKFRLGKWNTKYKKSFADFLKGKGAQEETDHFFEFDKADSREDFGKTGQFKDEIDEIDEDFWDDDFKFRDLDRDQGKGDREFFNDLDDLQREFNIEIKELRSEMEKNKDKQKDKYVHFVDEDEKSDEVQGDEGFDDEGTNPFRDFISEQKRKQQRHKGKGKDKNKPSESSNKPKKDEK